MSKSEKEATLKQQVYIYKRALLMLSKVTANEVKEHLTCNYEEYVQGVAQKHLELAKPYDTDESEEDEIDIEALLLELDLKTTLNERKEGGKKRESI